MRASNLSKNRVVVPARQATQPGGIRSLESILGLLKSFKIRALLIYDFGFSRGSISGGRAALLHACAGRLQLRQGMQGEGEFKGTVQRNSFSFC